MNRRKQQIARRFSRAAGGYDDAAAIQAIAARRLARLVDACGLPAAPRVLEIGGGTGLLTRRLLLLLPGADWTVTDLSEGMVRQAKASSVPDSARIRFLVMDGEQPAVRPGFDLICCGLAMQWFSDRRAALHGLAGLLNPGGLLAVSTLCHGSFAGWRESLRQEGLADASLAFATETELQQAWPADGSGTWQFETLLDRHENGIAFLRSLRAIGADLPRESAPRSLDAHALRRVLDRFETGHDAVADYRVGYGLFRRAGAPGAISLVLRGVFVTGTDTGVGKTLVSACLVRAWGAHYWKPLQTGLAGEPGDTETVAALAGLEPARIIPPVAEFQAPLSPQAAAALEGVVLDPAAIRLPDCGDAPLVVEGAGGLMVPIAGETMMIDLVQRLGLPAVLVARGTLGTINHTLLSLGALRARGIAVAGVVISGDCSDGNRRAIEQHGRVRIIAQLPSIGEIDAERVAALARLFPPIASL